MPRRDHPSTGCGHAAALRGLLQLLPGYGLAALAVAVVTAARVVAWPVLRDHIPWIPFALPIIVAACYGGVGPGLAAMLLSILATDYFLLAPYHSVGVSTPSHVTGIAVFTVTGTLELHGRTRPLSMPLVLTHTDGVLHATGEVMLDLRDFEAHVPDTIMASQIVFAADVTSRERAHPP